MEDRMAIQISFKRYERDLYELIMKKGDKSNFLKEAAKFYIQYGNQQIIKSPVVLATEDLDGEEINSIIDSI